MVPSCHTGRVSGWTTRVSGCATEPVSIRVAIVTSSAPVRQDNPVTSELVSPDAPWVTIVWNDPVNLMSYVTYVFQTMLGHPKPKAEKLMLDVHHKGRATVSVGSQDAMEADVAKLQAAGLWATMAQDR